MQNRINTVCSKGKGSVPRGRVYANYASRCATERITVLNPASFGKLVRVLFPGLKTRRLGVRGESKYHYVNFSLVDDQPDLRESQPPAPRPLPEAKSLSQSFKYVTQCPSIFTRPGNESNVGNLARPSRAIAILQVVVPCPRRKRLAKARKVLIQLNPPADLIVCTTSLTWPASIISEIPQPRRNLSSHSCLPIVVQ